MILIYLDIPLGMPGHYGLELLQDISLTLTESLPSFPVVHLPSDCGEIWMSVDDANIHMEWWVCMVLQNF